MSATKTLLPVLLCLSSWSCLAPGRLSSGSACEGPLCGFACRESSDCPCDSLCLYGQCRLRPGQEEQLQLALCRPCHSADECFENEVCTASECMPIWAQQGPCEQGGSWCPAGRECVGQVCMLPCAGVRCGQELELCCGTDELCEADRCLLNCGERQRCGKDFDVCCAAGEICYGFACTPPGALCQHHSDCPAGQLCEADLGMCLPINVIGTCEYHPPVGEFSPQLECRWTPPADQTTPERNDVVMAPVVANLTDDNGDGKTDTLDIPDIVFSSYNLDDPSFPNRGCCNVNGTLRIVSGRCNPDRTMRTLASLADPPLDNSAGLALGDLDGDQVPEIVGMLMTGGRPQGTVAFKRLVADGSAWVVYWQNVTYPTFGIHTKGATQPSLADLDSDGRPEVVVGNVVLNGQDGTLKWDGVVTSNGLGGIGNNAFLGPVSSVADLDRDGHPEVLAGNTVYAWDGGVRWTYEFTSANSPCGGGLDCDGYTAAAEFDEDPEAELVIVRLGEIFVVNHDGTLLRKIVIPKDDCPHNESGPPTVADFDGDGRPEIGTAAADYYVVVDLDCVGTPAPEGCAMDGVLWFVPNQDCSSRVTASSVFDFEGDGRAEVIYADETSFRIFDGRTGAELFVDDTHGSHTRLEMSVIADVDNDGNAEVVIAENASCGGTPGVEVWGDAADNWVFTRRIWNQHSYHVRNISETGVVPQQESTDWQDAQLNSFRQNAQGVGVFWALDLVITDLMADCSDHQTMRSVFNIMNQGSRLVGPGAAATLYVNDQPVQTVRTTRSLLPGQYERMAVEWTVPDQLLEQALAIRVRADDVGQGQGEHNECEDGGEDNNEAAPVESPSCQGSY